MKIKLTKIFVLVLSLVLPLLAACSDEPAEGDEISSSSSHAPVTSSQSASEASPPSAREAPDEESEQVFLTEAEIIAQIEQAVSACSDVIDNFVIDIDQGSYPMPTLEEYSEISEAIGALGYPVDCYDLDMPNYEKVQDFWADVQAGNDAQVIIFWLHNTGIYADILSCRAGDISFDGAGYGFQSYFEPDKVSKVEFYENGIVDNMRMTEKGWLRYQLTDDLGQEQEKGYRVTPLGEENRELSRKYLDIAAYYPRGLFKENWNQDNYIPLSLPDAFLAFYQKEYEDFPSEYAISNPDDGEAIVQVPADAFENLMLKHLPFTQEQLREWGAYDAAKNVYIFDCIVQYSFLYTEVSAFRENEDGSFTLIVDEVSDSDDEVAISYELTVMDNPDGSVKYISNKAIEE